MGTFNPTLINEVRANASAPLGADGFAPGSLLSVFMFSGSQLHNGAANSLTQVLENVEHRSAGTGGVDTLATSASRQKVVKFLQSIDGTTPPIQP